MELVILKARAQLNRHVSEKRRRGGGEGEGARARRRNMASAPREPAPWLDAALGYNASLYNASLAYNASRFNLTYDADYDQINGNTTDEQDSHWFCAKWTNAQQDLFQAANLCFAIAFLAPKSFKQSILVLRALACAGAVLMGMWAGADVCAPDVLAWNLALVLVNSVHTIFLIIRFLPPALSLELTELYLKLFKPLRVNKKHFQELTREARLVRLDPGEAYAVEDVTPADERLSILLKGKMRVSCDGTHLHFIQPHQFIDSPEWEANREQSDDVFQVSVVAEEVCTCVCWPRMRLERVLRHRPALKVVLDCLIGEVMTELKSLKSIAVFTMHRVENIEDTLKRIRVPSQCEDSPSRLLPDLPLTELRHLKSLEEKMADEQFEKQLFNMLRYTGGSRERDCVNRCLEKIFTNYLAQFCSWTGKKNNFKLSSLKVMTTLKRKDITLKLYSVSEGLTAGGAEREVSEAHLTRSASVDAVHEGTRGRLRSVAWRARSTTLKGSSYWQPMVARQFLLKSPFGRGVPRLLTQASSASLQPPRPRSPPRRAPSFRRGREVKFAESTQETV